MLRLDKRKVLFIVGILVSIVCSWLFARKIEWASLIAALREANYVYIIPTIIIIFILHYLRAFRWMEFIIPIKRVSVLNLFSASMIGFMANSILPARAGEIIRPIIIARKEKIKITALFATVVMERVFDILIIIVMTSFLFLFLPSNTHIFNGLIVAIMVSFGIFAITFLFLLSLYPERAGAVLERFLFLFPHHLKEKLVDLLHSFISGLQVFDNKKQLIWIGGQSLVIWLLNAASVYVLCYSFRIDLSFAGACFVMICLALAVALPQAPGFIGVFHMATQKSMDVFGVELSSSQSFAIILWMVSIIPTTVVGILFLWKEGISFGEISHIEEKIPV
ncbi:MAG: flippase-like domain-containing protein [Candidatus Brocadiaceae bacterium]|nr:flippase-like domain-containing protein [Candidatus Brocadiaceae bacterium]